jgi:D-arabinose 1-dehydrogenase-like Zn-dependent alcohol dehydrogenase
MGAGLRALLQQVWETAMQKTMKAAVVRAFGEPLEIEEVEVPEVAPGTVLVKVEACGVCHTDLHAVHGDFPVVLGGITVRGSIVGTRLDLQEALDFAAEGKVRAHVATARLEEINDVFRRIGENRIDGRNVLDMTA